ncbi:hypothetical protein D9M71_430960 [compost metagenome]
MRHLAARLGKGPQRTGATGTANRRLVTRDASSIENVIRLLDRGGVSVPGNEHGNTARLGDTHDFMGQLSRQLATGRRQGEADHVDVRVIGQVFQGHPKQARVGEQARRHIQGVGDCGE